MREPGSGNVAGRSGGKFRGVSFLLENVLVLSIAGASPLCIRRQFGNNKIPLVHACHLQMPLVEGIQALALRNIGPTIQMYYPTIAASSMVVLHAFRRVNGWTPDEMIAKPKLQEPL